MPIQLYISNRLEQLAKRYCNVSQSLERSIFRKDIVITQTEGMNRWLSLEIAKETGIFAHFQFIKPNEFISYIQKIIRLPLEKSLDKHQLKWIIYDLLVDEEFQSRYPDVAAYYKDNLQKRIHLSMQLADLFDQYVIYRTDFIDSWNADKKILNEDGKPLPHAEWQAWIWQKIKAVSEEIPKDRVETRQALLDALDDPINQNILINTHPRVALFGLSVLTSFHIQILHKLAEFISMDCYFLNPSPKEFWYINQSKLAIYWATKRSKMTQEQLLLQSGNTLLTNNGRLGIETFSMMLEFDIFINALNDDYAEEPESNTLLSKIQHDIYNNAEHKNRCVLDQVNLQDFSIQISSSYTPLREVEALYNYLLKCFEIEGKQLTPKDILILTTDIDLYAPYIRAVFDNASHKMPYSIADQSHAGYDNLPGILDALLHLSEDYFTPNEVLQLLDITLIQDKFDLKNDADTRQIIRDAYIRIGIEGEREDDSYIVSWKAGFDKIFLGYAIPGSPNVPLSDGTNTYPLDSIEGTDLYVGFRLKVFVDSLINMFEERKKSRSLSEWKQYIDDKILEPFIAMDDDHAEELKYIQFQLDQLVAAYKWMNKKISFEVFKEAFTSALFDETRKGKFIDGRITFCSMIPMRSIPFKVVGMLGMNRDKYPRRYQKLGFNLMENEHRKGDRNSKNSDRYLFLEFLISTKKYFYLSYIGQLVTNNKILLPSLLIDELLEYIRSGLKDPEEWEDITIKHPLYSFSPRYFGDDQKLYSYIDYRGNQSSIPPKFKEESDDLILDEIELKVFTQFWAHPIKWYYRNILNINYDERYEEDIPDHELFDLSNLEKAMMRTDLLIHRDDIDIDRLKKNGKLPLKSFAEIEIGKIEETIKELKKYQSLLIEDMMEVQLEINLTLGESKLSGIIDGIYGDKHVVASTSKSSKVIEKFFITWIQHLCIAASGKNIDSYFISLKHPEPIILSTYKTGQKFARAYLFKCLEYFSESQFRIIPFLPDLIKKPMKDYKKTFIKKSETQYKKNYFDQYIKTDIQIGTLRNGLDNSTRIKEIYFDLIEPMMEIYKDEIKLVNNDK